MKTAEWFVCLPYKNVDILIPQDMVQRSSYAGAVSQAVLGRAFANGTALTELDSDSGGKRGMMLDRTLFPGNGKDGGPAGDAKIVTELFLKTSTPVTLMSSALPRVEYIKLSDFRVFSGMLGKALLRHGIVACRFVALDNGFQVQYVIDAEKLFGLEGGPGE